MKLEISRHSLQIVPETTLDVAFIEEVLGLRKDDDSVPLRRVDIRGLSHPTYIEARKEEG